MGAPSKEAMLERERIANRRKHWVRLATACNSRCLFCLDSDTPRNLFVPTDEAKAELRRGREELDADKVILSGGEATLHQDFLEIVAYAKSIGYDRVQTVTNGYLLGRKDFHEQALQAGLGEITYSLHGHTAALHDELTGTPGAFERITKAIARSVRDPRVICNVDVVICKPNVAVLDRIVELAISLGVTEFDLLHVIPQAAAYEHRDALFYDPLEHLPTLHKVFRLNRHPGFVVWTNRFPIPMLEGMEDLIQDPHKMLDEVNGRRFQLRRYLDAGTALDCRQPERCVHCFIEPFCTTTDRTVAAQNRGDFEVWDLEGPLPRAAGAFDASALPAGALPFGASRLGFRGPTSELLDLPLPARLDASDAGPLPAGDHVVVASTPEQLAAWCPALPEGLHLDVLLTQATAVWLAAHRGVLPPLDRFTLVQPAWETLQEAAASDVRRPRAFFEHLDLPGVRVAGLPACLAPGATLVPERRVLPATLFEADTGRLAIHPLARHHVARAYRSRSLRCRDCRVQDRCEGPHVNMVRDQGLGMLRPLVEGPWAEEAERQLRALQPEPPTRLATGRPPEPVAPSLPGHEGPAAPPVEPLATLAAARDRARARRKAAHRGEG